MSATTFQRQMSNFVGKAQRNVTAVYRGAAKGALNSIKYGSPITGAPGQPVEKGDLRESWVMEQRTESSAFIYTDSPYAQSNEDGIARPGGGPYELRSAEGGRWSVRKTRLGFRALVRYVADTINAGRSARR